jgi:hypothetical protein
MDESFEEISLSFTESTRVSSSLKNDWIASISQYLATNSPA